MVKKHGLTRLTESLYNVPHFVLPSTLDIVLSYLDKRNIGLEMDIEEDDDEENDGGAEIVGGIGYINISGALTYRPVRGICGEVVGCSYTGLLEQFETMAEAGVKTIVMEFSTPGGQASHIFEYADEIRAICDEYEIELLGYAQEMACSAGYALLCQCDEVIVNPDAVVGSIGCVVALTDISKAMEKEGIRRIFISAGSAKVPFADDGSFKPEFIAKVQKDVDKANEMFVTHVSKHTGLSAEEIKNFNAETFDAQEALEKGLVNSVMTNAQFAAYVAAKHKLKQLGAM